MTTTLNPTTARDDVADDLTLARMQFVNARIVRDRKDTPEHRQLVKDAQEHIDNLLDLLLAL